MARISLAQAGSANMRPFLDTLAWSEIGPALLAKSDDGYNVLVGSTADHPLLFKSYNEHPMIRNAAMNSNAAGRYQFMGMYWEHYKAQLHLLDFGPIAQDLWAIQLIRECGAIADVAAGNFASALFKCRSRWASLPGAGYGQHENALHELQLAYLAAGGALA